MICTHRVHVTYISGKTSDGDKLISHFPCKMMNIVVKNILYKVNIFDELGQRFKFPESRITVKALKIGEL